MKRIVLMAPLGAILLGGAIGSTIAQPASAGATGRTNHTRASMIGRSSQSVVARHALSISQAQHRVEAYARQYGNSHLVIDEVLEFQQNYYAIVKDTTTGHGAFEVLVNKWSGLVFPEYGPAMMWNTKYGMMRGGGMMGNQYPNGSMTISAASAMSRAQLWLRKHQSGTTVETPDQFPGYYTVHIHRNGVIAGMLSVNGYTGKIWYHRWHGKFIQIKRVNG